MHFVYKTIASPVGTLKLVADDDALVGLLWDNDRPQTVPLDDLVRDAQHPILLKTEQQLKEYFAGRRKSFSLPLHLIGTPFQKDVWAALLTIPFGETRSYLQIASQLGNPSATRAVGAANGKNPISIVVPCHRVIAKSGALQGFAGGLETKKRLLALEQA